VRVVGVSEADSTDPRVRIVRQRHGRLGGLRTTGAYAAAVVAEMRRQPRLVQAMTWRALLPAFLARGKAPVVLYCMGGELVRAKGGPAEVALRRAVLRRVDGVGAISHYTRGLVQATADRDAVVIHPPIRRGPTGEFARPARDGVRVLAVGRLVANKGHDRLIRAVALARAKGAPLQLTIVGRGPEEPQLRNLVRELGLDGVVTLAGGIGDDELDGLYRDADVFALLSVPVAGEVEGFGIVFLEANSYELPVVAGRSGGSTDAVEDGVSGIVVDDEHAAADALAALATDPERRRALGVAGRKRLDAFTLDGFGEQLRAWHERVRADHQARP
jgi:glycosyltransferase involved in cell wall biosynthesis